MRRAGTASDHVKMSPGGGRRDPPARGGTPTSHSDGSHPPSSSLLFEDDISLDQQTIYQFQFQITWHFQELLKEHNF